MHRNCYYSKTTATAVTTTATNTTTTAIVSAESAIAASKYFPDIFSDSGASAKELTPHPCPHNTITGIVAENASRLTI